MNVPLVNAGVLDLREADDVLETLRAEKAQAWASYIYTPEAVVITVRQERAVREIARREDGSRVPHRLTSIYGLEVWIAP